MKIEVNIDGFKLPYEEVLKTVMKLADKAGFKKETPVLCDPGNFFYVSPPLEEDKAGTAAPRESKNLETLLPLRTGETITLSFIHTDLEAHILVYTDFVLDDGSLTGLSCITAMKPKKQSAHELYKYLKSLHDHLGATVSTAEDKICGEGSLEYILLSDRWPL